VFDVSSPKFAEELKSVEKVLKELSSWNKPKIFVANKIDLLVDSPEKAEDLRETTAGKVGEPLVFVSAVKGWGLDKLKELIKLTVKFGGSYAEQKAGDSCS
jgi:GTP-binding protein HflX